MLVEYEQEVKFRMGAGSDGTYPEIIHANVKSALRIFKQHLRMRCGISILLQ